jgi:hypothetical protein
LGLARKFKMSKIKIMSKEIEIEGKFREGEEN